MRLFIAPQYQIKRTIAAVPGMGTANAGNGVRMGTARKPVADFGTDRAPPMLTGNFGRRTRFSCDDQQHPQPGCDRHRQRGVQEPMRAIERVAVQIDGAIRRDLPSGNASFPPVVEVIGRTSRQAR